MSHHMCCEKKKNCCKRIKHVHRCPTVVQKGCCEPVLKVIVHKSPKKICVKHNRHHHHHHKEESHDEPLLQNVDAKVEAPKA